MTCNIVKDLQWITQGKMRKETALAAEIQCHFQEC